MYCPICHAEFREGFLECTDCDVDLVEKLEPMRRMPGFVKMATIFREGNIAVIKASFDKTEIEYFFEGEHSHRLAGDLGTDRIAVAARHPKTGENIFHMITVTWMNPAPILESRNVPLFLDQDNHKYITITPDMVIDRAEDVFGNTADLAAVSVVSVSSDEPEDHIGDGSTMDDILIECPNRVMLRTERMGGEQGRVYTIHYRLTDANGTTADDEMRIVIVKDNSDSKPVAYNRGAGYTVSPECERREIDIQF